MTYSLKDITDQAKYVVYRSLVEKNANNQTRSLHQQFSHYLKKLERIYAPTNPYKIAFTGLTNVGKSTLLNALLGQDIAPVKNCPWSSIPVEYSYGKQVDCILHFHNSFKKHTQSFHDSSSLCDFLRAWSTEEMQCKNIVTKLEIHYPSSILNNLIVVDTPGYGATGEDKEDVDSGLHDTILLNYLNKYPQRVFWITRTVDGDIPGQSDISFFKEHISPNCTDIIVNYQKAISSQDIHLFTQRLIQSIGSYFPIYFLNAKAALQSLHNFNHDRFNDSGLQQIKTLITKSSNPSYRLTQFGDELIQLFLQMQTFLHEIDPSCCYWVESEILELNYRLKSSINNTSFNQSLLSILQNEA